MIAKSHHYQLTALAVAALLGLWGTQANALSLGRITVQSALGEPLKAEIDVLEITPDEAASLSTQVATPDAFQAAGLEYNPALSGLQATLQRRSDGRAYLRLSTERAIGDPFVDMILETRWSSGRIVRDYTLLLDPPGLRPQARVAPVVSAQLPAPTPAPGARPSPARAPALPAQSAAPATEPVKPAVAATRPAPAPRPSAASQTGAAERQTLQVKPGDTAGQIAASHKPASISLDQMLVALLRANPQAFISDNVNRIKAGAIVTLPDETQAAQTEPAEATRIVNAQSQDFNDFRRKFASNAPVAGVAPASREVAGKIEAVVEDKKPAAATADKLTLSKGTAPAAATEDQLAQARNADAAASRAAELAKNIADLDKLAAAASMSASASEPAAAAPAAAVSEPAAAASAASEPVPVAQVASAPAVKKPMAPPVALPEPAPEPNFIDTLMEDPLLPAGAGGLAILLLLLGLYKARQRKKATESEGMGTDTDMAFSGASGGQSVDTGDSLTTGSSMVYSPSQLDAVDDVDPVAEADVYLAYGRDSQAEEILKDALRNKPQRLAIHLKLLDIYAKRRDTRAFEALAALAFNLTGGTGPEWEQICEKGLSIDPDNALYLPGGQPAAGGQSALAPTQPAALGDDLSAAPAAPDTNATLPMDAGASTELDLDLDFSLDDAAPELPAASATPQDTAAPPPSLNPDDEMDLDLPLIGEAPELAPTEEPAAEEPDFALVMPDLELSSPDATAAPASAAPAQASPPDDGMMAFDLGSLSMDLGEHAAEAPSLVDDNMDPLETKLALAEEFRAIGDDDGARALIEEVIAEAAGDLKSKAQAALSKL